MLVTPHRRVGVFIDVQNMYYSARNIFNRKVNFASIVEKTVGEADLIRAIAYTISTKTGDESAFFEALRKKGIEVASKELLEYNSGVKKGDWDVGITIDIVRMLDMLDVVVLVSGDGDYVPLANHVKSRGRIMHVASFRESTSTALVSAVDIYTNLSDDQKTFLIPDRKAASPRLLGRGKKNDLPIIDEPMDEETNDDARFEEPVAQDIGDQEENRSRRLSF